MEFTEAGAKAAQEAWGLSPSTIKVWRHRGAIPDDYGSPPATLAQLAHWRLDPEWLAQHEESIREAGPQAWQAWETYKAENRFPRDITEKNLRARLYDWKRKMT